MGLICSVLLGKKYELIVIEQMVRLTDEEVIKEQFDL